MKKNKKIIIFLLTIVLFFTCLTVGIRRVMAYVDKDYKVSAYLPIWCDWTGNDVNVSKLTNVYIAFANINTEGKIGFKNANIKDEDEIFRKIREFRKTYPKIKISLGIGGYKAEGFSDVALTKESRKIFCDSVAKFVDEYKLDGVDIDWEFPGIGPEGGIKSRKEDKENFTLLLSDLRDSLKELEKKNKKSYELSFAETVLDYGVDNIEVEKVNKIVDCVNVMGYDYTGVWSDTTAHNANLYKADEKKDKISTSDGIKKLIDAGFDSKKLIMGIPAYGYGWEGVKDENNGLYQKAEKPIDFLKFDLSYRGIVKKYLNKDGFKRYWDDKAKVPYLYNGNIFITYEDKESAAFKTEYIKENKLGGGMIWECSQDNAGELTKVVYDKLRK
ncbi:chitinase [Clostridium cavendishii DSM 21758]|uniref:chitinase n=1 Tax=Clostridium cavendishii DSM 21758 TaxID=1121302 RepID=A0A1M6GDN6_9CLOT|nr:glycosyl hydrolase family 18 protein [Clostridium cavendishii]SHJ08075.1 chitinase [Clostridium cavendishii DSM 21758]